MAATPRARSLSPDAVEIFADSLESLYDHHMPAHGDPLQLYTYRPSDPATKAFTVRLPPQQVNSLFAHHVWNASLRLADLIADGRLPVRGLSVLEMGAGAGIPALMAARAGAEQVVISDYDDAALVANLRDNVQMALEDVPKARSRTSAHGHTWGEEPSLQQLLAANSDSRFSLILLADTLWMSSGHELLLSSLRELLARSDSARVAICAGFHSGRATVRSFLRKAERAGFVRRGAWEELGVDGRRRPWGWDCAPKATESGAEVEAEVDDAEWAEKEDASERNKWVVEGLLGWSDLALAQGA